MTEELIPARSLVGIGQIANAVARQTVLIRYLQERSAETIRRQKSDIALFEKYLGEAQYPIEGMQSDLSLWEGVTYGLVSGFQQWLLLQGYAIKSINVRFATIKTYCNLANQSDFIDAEEMAKIRGLKGFNRKAGRNIDEKRATQRVGKKKGQSVLISYGQVELIKMRLEPLSQDDIIAARDRLLFCLLADHGLRCGEVAGLESAHLDLFSKQLVFYRRKVDKTQIHHLTADTLKAATCYLRLKKPGAKLFEGYQNSRRNKRAGDGLTTRAINGIVARLGRIVGIGMTEAEPPLSPHDLRHYWATQAVRSGTDTKALQQAGGWNSPYMPLLYASENEVANEGVKLS